MRADPIRRVSPNPVTLKANITTNLSNIIFDPLRKGTIGNKFKGVSIATITMLCRNVLLQDYKPQHVAHTASSNDIHDYFHCTRVRVVNSTNESTVKVSQLQNHHATVQGERTHKGLQSIDGNPMTFQQIHNACHSPRRKDTQRASVNRWKPYDLPADGHRPAGKYY